MDPPPAPAGASGGCGGGGRRRVVGILLRCCSGIVFSVAASFFVSFAVGIVAIVVGSVSSSSPVSVPAACRILSTNVDLRSSKVCELGMWNFKASNILYTSGRTGFRCRDDYYWASVLEVEYKEYFSGQIVHAMAEAPKQALPPDCRPSFSSVWSNKMRFKVNETYGCTYTLGSRKAEIDSADIFGCKAKDPSMAEMARRYFMLFARSTFLDIGSSGRKAVYAVSGVVSGMLAAMCLTILAKCVQASTHALSRRWRMRKSQFTVVAARTRRFFLLVAYFSAMGWLTLQYGKMIGLEQLFFHSSLKDKAITR